MSSVEQSSESAAGSPPVQAGEVKLKVVVVPVSDVDRAKSFYEALGWRLDADLAVDEGYRVVQLTPPGSACSIIFGKGVTSARPAPPMACSSRSMTSTKPEPTSSRAGSTSASYSTTRRGSSITPATRDA